MGIKIGPGDVASAPEKRQIEQENMECLEELLVGSLAMGLGIFSIMAAVFQWDWVFRLPKVRLIEARFRRRGAKYFYLSLGCLLLAIGVAIAVGWRPSISV